MEDELLAEVAADRFAFAARAPAKFMRYSARAAAVFTLELRDIEDAMDAADALTVASLCLEIGRRRGRPISAATVKKVCICAIALRISIEVQLLPAMFEPRRQQWFTRKNDMHSQKIPGVSCREWFLVSAPL